MANETNPVPARSDEFGGPDTAGLPVAAVVPADEVSTEALRKAESYIEAEEGATNRLVGAAGLVTTGIAVVMRRSTSGPPTTSCRPRSCATSTSPSCWC